MQETTVVHLERCRSCNAPIIWCRHINTGRPAPIDADPSPDGNIVINGSTYSVVVRATTRELGPFHMNHFVTCPNAAQHTKAKE